MPARSSPTVKRRRLATELRRYRDEAGLTIEETADRLEWSTAKISRIENARVSVLPRDVRHLLDTYGVTDNAARELMLSLARESRQKGWWQQYGDAVPEWFEVYVGLEADASTISTYQAEFVPGLLQTADYARAVHRAYLINVSDQEIDKRVAVRLARQERLTAPDAPQLWAIVNEAAIRRTVGGASVMCAQLKRMIEASQRPDVTLQVLPFSVGAHPAMASAFTMLSFPEPTDPDVVYIEYPTGTLYLEKTPEVQRYTLIFDHLRAAALHVDDSQAFVTRVAAELT